MTILDTILEHKLKEVAMLPNFMERDLRPNRNSLTRALSEKAQIHIISEVKQASPSKGHIRSVNPAERAKLYEQSGATVLSCLTDEAFFGGNCEDLQMVSEAVSIPVIRKDFIFTKNQIAQARYAGAASYLLMMEVIEKTGANLTELIEYGRDLGMEPLVEIQNEVALMTAVQAGAKIIGVNSRNFQKEGLPIEFERFEKLLPLIPKGILRVAESGICTTADVKNVSSLADAVLIGTVLMEQKDEAVREFISSLQTI
jgi:indole-3-glycerol phosphate synthase